MKKITFVFITTILLSFNAVAQEETDIKGTTTFGIKGGLNQSFIYNSDNSGGLSFYGGLFAETRLSKRWSIQNELLFSQAKNTFTPNDITFVDNNDLTLFEVPIHLKYYITDKLSVFGGPKLSFLAAGNAENVGLSFEAGVQYDISKRFFLEARYSYDLFNQVTTRPIASTPFFDESSLGLLRFGIGYKF